MQLSFNLDVDKLQFNCHGFVAVFNYINIEAVYSEVFEKRILIPWRY